MRNLLSLALLAPLLSVAAVAAQPAPAATSQAMTCPIGGATFQYSPPLPLPATATRPDGKPYRAGAIPQPLPECPDNGLVLYKNYSEEEVAKLTPLVASEAYQALRSTETQYYRAYWLMREMGLSPEDYLWVLLQASWEAERDPEQRARYLALLAVTSATVTPAPEKLNWIGMEARAINALRELKRFDEALARLDKVPVQAVQAGAAKSASEEAAREARLRRVWLDFFKDLRPVIERKDASLEPLELIPRSLAIERCADPFAPPGTTASVFCTREAASVQATGSEKARAAAELEALRKSREASGR